MSLTLRVTYAATDGSVPESVELEWPDIQPAASTVLPLLDRLLRAPAERAAMQPAAPDEPRCKRTVCGHRQSDHGEYDDMGREVAGPHLGSCRVCDNPDQCRSFVGSPIQGYLLPHDAKRGEILGLRSDGSVCNVGRAGQAEQLAMAGPSSGDLKAGSRVNMMMGRWVPA